MERDSLARRRCVRLGSPQRKAHRNMTDNKVWFVTGAGRGMGIDIAKAALAPGPPVVAAGRAADRVRDVIGEHDDLLAVALDITDPDAADAAARAAVERFGRIDVLGNNTGHFHPG